MEENLTRIPKSNDLPGNCAMCASVASPVAEWDRPVFNSPNFVVVPSLGALIEGWLLIVPRTHAISMGGLSSECANEMSDLKDLVWDVLESIYGCVVGFEHGPSAPGAAIGCGVDHAHFHLVPMRFDLVRAAAAYVPPDTVWSRADWNRCRSAYKAGIDYLYVEQRRSMGQIAVGRQFGSQVLRKAIADALGKPDQFNWRTHPQRQMITATVEKLGRLESRGLQMLSRIA